MFHNMWKHIFIWCFQYSLINNQYKQCWTLDSPVCNLKDPTSCTTTNEQNSHELQNRIDSIFDDKINYHMKFFDDETVIELKTFERNLSEVTANFTLIQLQQQQKGEEEEEQKYKQQQEEQSIAEAIENDEKEFINAIGERWLSYSQPFDASLNPDSSELCRQHTKLYLESINKFELWALKMYDATGKLTSGILNGNINQHGDFDQCLNIKRTLRGMSNNNKYNDEAESNEIKGKYCLAYAQPVFNYKSKRLQQILDLVQSHSPFKSEFNDPGHRVPRYSLVNWGICVPSSCSAKDIEYSVKEFLNNVTISTGLSFIVRVEPEMCTVRDNNQWDRATKWAIRFFAAILSISILSTIYNRCTKYKPQHQNEWLTVFALDKNWNGIFEIKRIPDDIKTVHGIRFINAVMLLLSHKSMAMFFNPYNNRTEMAESLGRPWTVIGRAASLYTDPFLLISGCLTAYSLFGRLRKGQAIRLKNEYISRFIRIVPPLAALILFCTYVLPLIGSGPQWNLVIGHHATICKKHWWRNLLFIHNYFGFSDMCLTHTHHLGIDTELFAVAPVIILTIWKWPKNGLILLLTLCGIGTAARYYTTMSNELSNYVYFGTNIKRLFRTADLMYSFPPMRSTVYLMGILLGFLLRMYPDFKLNTMQLRLGWFFAIICVTASLLGPAPMGDISYKYNSTHAAAYAAFAPIAWCLFFSWIVFVSHNGYTNRITKFFSWKYYQVSTKLSYAIYLTQFPVYFFNVGRRRHVYHYYNFITNITDTNEYICIFIASVVLTLLFDTPFQNIKKLLLKRLQPVAKVNRQVAASGNRRETTATEDAIEKSSHEHRE